MPNHVLLGTARSLVFAAALLALSAAWAQTTGVKGVVRGPNGPVAGATVWLSRRGGPEIMVKTNQDGRFNVELPAGTYSMDIYAPGLVSVTRAEVQVVEGQTADVPTTLERQRPSP